MNMLTIPSPLEVKRRHERRRISELHGFIAHGGIGETYRTTTGRLIHIRRIELLDGNPHWRKVTLAYTGSTRTWEVWK